MKRLMATMSFALVVALAMGQTVPNLINYQGFLEDDSGTAITGNVPIEFSVYPSSTGGTLLWSEDHPSISVNDGVFSVILGSVEDFPEDLFENQNRYLQIEIDGSTISPRQRIVSSAFAINAEKLDGHTWDEISPGIDDHGELDGLEDDDHPQYFLSDGTRSMNGQLDMNSNAIDNVSAIYKRDGTGVAIGSASNYPTGYFDALYISTINMKGNGNIRTYTSGYDYDIDDVEDITPAEDDQGWIGSSNYRFADIWCVQLHQGDLVENIEIVNPVQEFDVVVWQNGQLGPCNNPENKKVFGVASFEEDYVKNNGEKQFQGTGKYYPVIQGIYQIRVTGQIEEGDLLVTSSVNGCAMSSENPKPGTVIAQAMESSSGGNKVIKAMIRKF